MTSPARTLAPVNFLQFPLGAVVSASRDAVVMVDQRQHLVAVNAAAAQMFGYGPEELLGQPLSCLIPESLRAAHAHHVKAFADSGQSERRALRKDAVSGRRANGQVFPAEASISRVHCVVDGQPCVFFVALLRDLSPDPGLRAEVAKLNTQLRSVLDQLPVPIWIVSGADCVYANRAAAHLFGLPDRDQLVGMPVHKLLQVHGPADLQSHLDRALAQPTRPDLVNATVLRSDGQTVQVEIAATALPDHGQTVLQLVTVNITENRALLLEQAKLRQELRRLAASVVEAREEERRRIARELHDDLGQRLTVLKMEIAGLRNNDARRDDGARIAGMLEMVDSSVSALRRLAADLRPLMLDDLGLHSAIENLARDAASRMDIEVTVHVSAEDPALAPGADIALYRMVQEALANVGRHAGATDVHIELRKQADELVLTVRDNGQGFPARSMTHEGRYGLLGMRERALMLGGRLEIDNPPGGGGRVVVHLPLKPSSSPSPSPSPTPQAP